MRKFIKGKFGLKFFIILFKFGQIFGLKNYLKIYGKPKGNGLKFKKKILYF